MASSGGVAGSLEVLEGPIVRVPFDSLKRAAKERKTLIDRSDAAVQAALAAAAAAAADTGEGDAVAAASSGLNKALNELTQLKARMAEVSAVEAAEAARCQARLAHLAALVAPQPSMTEWNAPRLDRLLIDHLQR